MDPYTIEEHFDEFGFLVKQVDERGVATTYSHERRTGALKQKIEGQGSGKLNLTTDYLSDELGRITEELGPVHQILVSRAAKDVRRLKVTQYLDASDEVRVINGYMETAGAQPRVTINPVRITRHSAVLESGDAKWIENEIEAMYVSSDSTAGNNRVTDFRYDWPARLDEEETNDGTRVIITKYTYDNRGNVTGVKEYVTSVTANNLIAQAESFFDGRNRLYRTKRYGIDLAATGAARIKAALTTERYYDPSGNRC